MTAKLLQLVADVFFDVLERVEKCGGDRRGPGAIVDSSAEVLLIRMHQAAIGMIDDHEFLGAEQVVRYDQRTQRVVGYDAARISNNVRVSGLQPQGTDRQAGIHAGQYCELTLGSRSEFAQLVRARVNLICCQDFVDDAHRLPSLTQPYPDRTVKTLSAPCDPIAVPLISRYPYFTEPTDVRFFLLADLHSSPLMGARFHLSSSISTRNCHHPS